MKQLFTALAFCISCSLAFAERIGDWVLDPENDAKPFFFTANDSGGIFGKWCDVSQENCMWMLAVKTACEQDASAPGLVSTATGVAAVDLNCLGPHMLGGERYYRYAIGSPDLLDASLKRSERVSFVMAVEGDNFRVMRFNTQGTSAAISRLGAAITEAKKKIRPTRDRML